MPSYYSTMHRQVLLLLSVFINAADAFSWVQWARQMGQAVGRSEWSSIPREFQKGFEEGEMEARSRNARPIEAQVVKSDDEEEEEEEEEVADKKEN